jgi:hypothetical protein
MFPYACASSELSLMSGHWNQVLKNLKSINKKRPFFEKVWGKYKNILFQWDISLTAVLHEISCGYLLYIKCIPWEYSACFTVPSLEPSTVYFTIPTGHVSNVIECFNWNYVGVRTSMHLVVFEFAQVLEFSQHFLNSALP